MSSSPVGATGSTKSCARRRFFAHEGEAYVARAVVDELVELVPFTQTREYMKKVTENYARYRYLYANEIYDQPIAVDKHYIVDQLTY